VATEDPHGLRQAKLGATNAMWKRILKTEKAPLMLGVILGVISWGLTHIVDRLLGVNIIAYSETVTVGDDKDQHTFNIKNLSDVVIKDFVLSAVSPTGAGLLPQFGQVSMKPLRTAMVDDATPPTVTDRAAVFTVTEFQPGWEFELKVPTQKDVPLRLVFRSPSVPTVLEEAGWRTFVVEHETGLIAMIVLMATVLALWYLILIAT
jgi:hypothetical protein